MTTTFNLNLLAETQPSICIPRVFNNITDKKIRQVFDELSLGKISRIDIVKERKNEKGEVFNRVYIHFEKWFWNEDAQTARRKLILGKEIKIIYDKPWFWKVSASKWEPPKRCDNLSQKQVKSSSSVYIKYDDEEDDEFGRSLHLSDLNTDEFGRSLHLSDLNTDEFGRSLHLSDLNISTEEYGRDLSLSDLNISTDEFGRDLSLSDLNISTDEFGRDLSLKRDYEERRRIELINNFRPINRRLNDRRANDRRSNDRRSNDRRSNDRRSNDRRANDMRKPIEERVKEIEEEERQIRPFVSVDEDVDNLNIPKFEIDYGTPLIVPKINRKIIKKIKTKTVPKPQINWYDDDTDDDDEQNDTDVFLTEVFNKISINDIRPRSPDYPPPKNQEEEEEFDIYADLDLDL